MKKKKFKIGDFVVKKDLTERSPMKIMDVTSEGYVCDNGFIGIACEKNYRKWTFLDVVNGDILFNEDSNSICIFCHFDGIDEITSSFVCFCGLEGHGLEQELNLRGFHDDTKGYVPATSEQKKKLFEWIHNAGYEWNAETKQLVKIEEESSESLEQPDEYEIETFKFSPDDWISFGRKIFKVNSVKNRKYSLEDTSGDVMLMDVSDVDSLYHKWNIKDALPGDILVNIKNQEPFIYSNTLENGNGICAFCGLDDNNQFKVELFPQPDESLWTVDEVCPASRNMQMLMLKKMKDSGFVFDFTILKVRLSNELWNRAVENASNQIESVFCRLGDSDEELMKFGLTKDMISDLTNWLRSLGNKANDGYEWTEDDDCHMSRLMYSLKEMNRYGFFFSSEIRYYENLLDNFKSVRFGKKQDETAAAEWKIQDAQYGDVVIMKSEPGSERKDTTFIFYRINKRAYDTVCNCVEYLGCVNGNGKYMNNDDNSYMGTLEESHDGLYVLATDEQRKVFYHKMWIAGFVWDEQDKRIKKRQVQAGDILKIKSTGELCIKEENGSYVKSDGCTLCFGNGEYEFANDSEIAKFNEELSRNNCFYDCQQGMVCRHKKFKEGDWIASNLRRVLKVSRILKVKDDMYEIEYTDGEVVERECVVIDDLFHIWNITDAEPGDVLYDKNGYTVIFKEVTDGICKTYFSLDSYGNIMHSESDYISHKAEDMVPADKKQIDYLQFVMEKTGWKFDSDKNMLVKMDDCKDEVDKNLIDSVDDEFFQELGRVIAFWNQKHNDGFFEENDLMNYVKVRATKLVELARMKKPDYCHHNVNLDGNSEEYRKAYYDGWNNCNQQHAQNESANKSRDAFKRLVMVLCDVVEKSLND